MIGTKRLLALILVGGLAACNDATRPRMMPTLPQFAISDAAHQGTVGFYFLSPMVAQPSFSGSFDGDIATLNPSIALCDITNGPEANCGSAGGTAAVAVFTTTSTPAITVNPTTAQYQVNWDTRAAGFLAGHAYRVHVTAGASGARRELGFADVLLTTTPQQAKNLATGDLITMKDGQPLPIHFRIETGIAGSVSVSAATASLATGGTDLLIARVQDLHGAPLASTSVAWAATAGSGVVASLTPTSGLTDGSGQATTLLTAGTTPGTAAVTATIAGVSATATLTVTGGFVAKPLYVVSQGNNSVMVYAAGASGDATPIATIGGGNSGPLLAPSGIALDHAGNIYVTAYDGYPGIVVYAAGSTGNATPTTRIFSYENGPYSPTGITLDGAGNIYVADPGDRSIRVFWAGASGAAIPRAVISGGNTGLLPHGIALDRAGNIYVTNVGSDPYVNLAGNRITVFAAGANGNVVPMSTIAGDNTGLDEPTGIAVDGAGNMYVANGGSNASITVYAAGATGNATPIATIAGVNTGLAIPEGLVLDDAGNIYVANQRGGITVYAAGASGNATPIATIIGPSTGLMFPWALTF